MFKIILASPRWYCAGVDRAIDILNKALEKYWSPIYVNHEIIHNKYIVDFFKKKWAIFWEELENIPKNSIMIFSAHWVSPKYVKKVKERWLKYIDASCPLVIKVHNEAIKYIESLYKIIYIWQRVHPEAIWVKWQNPENIFIVSSIEDLKDLNFKKTDKIALLNQTTLSIDDTKVLIKDIVKVYPNIILPSFSDICYATTNRQNAVKKIIPEIDSLIIVGSKNSSNSTKLKLIWDKAWLKSYLIDNYSELPKDFLKSVNSIWISSGASVPDKLVKQVIKELKSKWWIFEKEVKVAEEKTIFPYSLKLK